LTRALHNLLSTSGGPAQIFYTTHSPILGAGEADFGMSWQDGLCVLEQRPCEGATSLPSLLESAPVADSHGPSPEDLDSLIGLVDQLAEIQPEELVAAAPAAKTPAAAAAPPPQSAPATPAAAPSSGVPTWKWQPKS
jgi:hypothetical protein